MGSKGLGAVVYWDSEELCDIELALAPSVSWISSLSPWGRCWGRCWGRAAVGFLLDAITLSLGASLLHRSGVMLWGCDEELMKVPGSEVTQPIPEKPAGAPGRVLFSV